MHISCVFIPNNKSIDDWVNVIKIREHPVYVSESFIQSILLGDKIIYNSILAMGILKNVDYINIDKNILSIKTSKALFGNIIHFKKNLLSLDIEYGNSCRKKIFRIHAVKHYPRYGESYVKKTAKISNMIAASLKTKYKGDDFAITYITNIPYLKHMRYYDQDIEYNKHWIVGLLVKDKVGDHYKMAILYSGYDKITLVVNAGKNNKYNYFVDKGSMYRISKHIETLIMEKGGTHRFIKEFSI